MRTDETSDARGTRKSPQRSARLSASTLERVRELLDAALSSDGFPALSEQTVLLLEVAVDGPPGGATLDARALDAEPVTILSWDAEGTELLGLGVVTRSREGWQVETVVHPLHRDDPEDLARSLLSEALGAVANRGGGVVNVWVRAPRPRDLVALRALGFAPGRTVLQLRMALPGAPLAPEARTFEVSAFRPGRDEQAWLQVNARAFADHPEQGSWTLSDLEQRERAPWFDPGGFLLHRDAEHAPERAGDGPGAHARADSGEQIAAFCWTKIHRTPLLGEIYVIGVDPDHQGRGFGRAILLAGLDHLAIRSVPTAMLYCESTNEAALVLYRSVGFVEHHRETAFRGEVAPQASRDDPDR